MVAYHQFVALSRSDDSNIRSQAAYTAAAAFRSHEGPADEQAALYAALVEFLEDPSVKVRASLAYGLLHESCAPRPIMIALLHDEPLIARAVAQYSPVLVDADLLALVKGAGEPMLQAIALREGLSVRLAQAILARGPRDVVLDLLIRDDMPISAGTLDDLAGQWGGDADIRKALLKRHELSAITRYRLIEEIRKTLENTNKGGSAIVPQRLGRMLRDAVDMAMTEIGEQEAAAGRHDFAAQMVGEDRINPRLMLHAAIRGHMYFFADCIGEVAGLPHAKVFALLARGSRTALKILFGRCGLSGGVSDLLMRLVFHSRSIDLHDDVAARHFVVGSLIEELIAEHKGEIPAGLQEAFVYLNEQNVALARDAVRGVMPAFANGSGARRALPVSPDRFVTLSAA